MAFSRSCSGQTFFEHPVWDGRRCAAETCVDLEHVPIVSYTRHALNVGRQRPAALASFSAFLGSAPGGDLAEGGNDLGALLTAAASGSGCRLHAGQCRPPARASLVSAFVPGGDFDSGGGASGEEYPPWGREAAPSTRPEFNLDPASDPDRLGPPLGGGPPPPGGWGNGNDTECTTCDCAPLLRRPALDKKIVFPNVPHHHFFIHRARKLKHRMLLFAFLGGAVLGGACMQIWRLRYLRARKAREQRMRDDYRTDDDMDHLGDYGRDDTSSGVMEGADDPGEEEELDALRQRRDPEDAASADSASQSIVV